MVPADIGGIIDIDQRLTGEQRTANQAEIITSGTGGIHDLSFIAEADNKIAGFLIARAVYIGEPVIETAAIQFIGVDPVYAGHGIASKLVNALVEGSKAKGIKAIRVMVGDRDSKLEGFYKHMGFSPAKLKVYSKNV